MRNRLSVIGFDADDTLWHNERFFRLSQERFADLLEAHTHPDDLMARLDAAERRNLGRYGYGTKGFVLSMIETAIDVTDRQVSARVIEQLLDVGRDMLEHPIELLDGARDSVETLARSHRIILVTKGDLLDQERKLAQSGLGELFDAVEIVSEKTTAVYGTVFKRHGHGPGSALMVGNSLKSDVIPAIEAGSWGVHVPHELTWAHEHATPPRDATRFARIEGLSALPRLVREIESGNR